MENKELKESYIDERTGIEYRSVGDYYIPNLVLENEEKNHFKQVWKSEVEIFKRK